MDHARREGMHAWLRHPVLGDPSFDSFERIGAGVHRSEEPYEWAVNGSLFRDPKDGVWYCYAGLYPHGYALTEKHPAHCLVYRSTDEGGSWTCLGPVFERGFVFAGYDVAADICPDAVLTYDEESDRYWLSYDWCTNNTDWTNAFRPVGTGADSGAALAWATSPAGPFTRLPEPHISNVALDDRKGGFTRMYGSTLLRRRRDWLALTLCDSSERFSWGLVAMTAPAPAGPWSEPVAVLSVERPEYYPAPVEFWPCFVVDGTVYAPATSVAASRNYQAVFSARLEEADRPEGWSLLQDGSVWHSRPSADETYGIWGQTFHGFVHDGVLSVVFPSKNERDRGTLLTAARPWDEPFRDGFTLSGHAGAAVAPLLAAYGDFALRVALDLVGTVDLAFDYGGVLGPNRNRSDAVPHPRALSGYSALRLRDDGRFELLTVDADGAETVHVEAAHDGPISGCTLRREGEVVTVEIAGVRVARARIVPLGGARPLALVAHAWSNVRCTRFEVDGAAERYELLYNGWDALLGAGQLPADWESPPESAALFRSGEALVGRCGCKVKWSVIGDGFDLYAPRSPEYGSIAIHVDGELSGRVDLRTEEPVPSAVVYAVRGLEQGRHSVAVTGDGGGLVTVDVLAVHGAAQTTAH